jgi:hypothetical protein
VLCSFIICPNETWYHSCDAIVLGSSVACHFSSFHMTSCEVSVPWSCLSYSSPSIWSSCSHDICGVMSPEAISLTPILLSNHPVLQYFTVHLATVLETKCSSCLIWKDAEALFDLCGDWSGYEPLWMCFVRLWALYHPKLTCHECVPLDHSVKRGWALIPVVPNYFSILVPSVHPGSEPYIFLANLVPNFYLIIYPKS